MGTVTTLLQIDLNALPATLKLSGPLSDRALWTLCRRNDLVLFERTREGEIRTNPPAGGYTGDGNLEIGWQLRDWWRKHKRGRTFDSNTAFHLPDGSMLSPDASYVSAQTLKGKSLKGFPRLCPDFVIELVSETDRLKDVQVKMQRWIENGALLAWLIEPYRRKVTVYRRGQKAFVASKATIAGEGPVQGFTLDLEQVWGGMRPRDKAPHGVPAMKRPR